MRWAFPVVFLFAALVAAAPPPAESPFTFPEVVVPPAPAPKPDPGAAPKLGAGQYYVVTSKTEASVKGYPAGLVTVTPEKGPLTVRALFVGGSGKIETKKFADPFVYLVEANGTGRTDLVVTPFGLKSDAEIVVKTIDVDNGTAPQPPPKPVDPVKPVDPLTSFRVFLIFESADTLTVAQRGVIYGKAVEDYLNANCTKDSAGRASWRRRDKDAPGDADATMKALWDAVKPNVTVTPCIAVERNGKVEIINLEATPAKMIEVLKTYTGGK